MDLSVLNERSLEAFRLSGEAVSVEVLGGRVDSIFFKQGSRTWGSVRTHDVRDALEKRLTKLHAKPTRTKDKDEEQILRWLFTMDFARPMAGAQYLYRIASGSLADWQEQELSVVSSSFWHMERHPQIREAALIDAQHLIERRWSAITHVADALLGLNPEHPLNMDALSRESIIALMS